MVLSPSLVHQLHKADIHSLKNYPKIMMPMILLAEECLFPTILPSLGPYMGMQEAYTDSPAIWEILSHHLAFHDFHRQVYPMISTTREIPLSFLVCQTIRFLAFCLCPSHVGVSVFALAILAAYKADISLVLCRLGWSQDHFHISTLCRNSFLLVFLTHCSLVLEH